MGVLEAGLQASRLEGLAIAHRADLAIGVLRGQPHFQVVGLGGAKTHVARAQAHHAVRQSELLQHGFGVARHFFQRVVALVGVHDLHHLDLVELVLADHAARIAAVAAGFGAEARCVGREFDRQVGLGHHHVAHKVGQWHFAGGDEVQGRVVRHGLAVLAALLGGEEVTLELRQLARALERVGVHGVGHVALGVAMLLRLHVQHELAQCAVQAGDGARHHGEARARELDAHVEVQAQRCAHIHMVLHFEIELGGGSPAAHFHVAMLVAAHGHAFVRQVGHGHQHGQQLGLDLLQAGGGLFQLHLACGHLGLDSFGAFLVAPAHQHADLLGQLVALGLQLFGAGLQRLALGLQRLESGDVQESLGLFAGFQPRDGGVEVFAEEEDVKHCWILKGWSGSLRQGLQGRNWHRKGSEPPFLAAGGDTHPSAAQPSPARRRVPRPVSVPSTATPGRRG